MTRDEAWMRRALALAVKGRGSVHPNPMVGAVLVRRGRIVAEGFHRQYGQAHAEAEAIRLAGNKAQGSTLYVNLEPCSHWGKTPPCAQAVVQAGIRRVVAAMRDPNPKVFGGGFRMLQKAGIALTSGVLENDAQELNRAFVTWVKQHRPFVTLKAASSLDGRTATIAGESKWITSRESRRLGHRLRAQVDAIAVGSGTVLADHPTLTAHGAGKNPIRILFDSKLSIPLTSPVFNRQAPSWSLTTGRARARRIDALKRKGIRVIICRADRWGRVDISDALHQLAAAGISHLLVEGGMKLQQSFLQAGMVDEVHWFVAPILIGGAKRLKNALLLGDLNVGRIGRDLHISAIRRR